MHADVLIFLLLLVIGFAAFIFGVLYFVLQLLAGIGRGIGRVFGGCCRKTKVPLPPRAVAVVGPVSACPNPRCGHRETRPARYCSQCGSKLASRGT